MADKKRKVTSSVPAPPTKKSKKTPAANPTSTEKPTAITASPAANEVVAKSKSGRKRAADFLGEEEPEAVSAPVSVETEKPSKKVKKHNTSEADLPSKKKGKKALLTADGVNGVVEQSGNAEIQIASANGLSSTSLEAEGLRTVDNELEEENLDASDDEDQGAALLAGFDSDSDDPAEDQGDMSKTQPIPQFKKTSKKLRQAKEKGSDGPGTVYVGRIPHGFYEKPMRDYFSQFGTIARLRLSRNKRTGASKHFAFIEFESDEVAKIVADTMDNYLMFGHILKCKYAPSENLHPDVWKGANKKYRKIPHEKLQRQQLAAPKSQEQWTKKNEKEQKKRQAQAEKLKAIGYEYNVPELQKPADVVEQRKIEQEYNIPAAIEVTSEQADAIPESPALTVPADEVALKKGKKVKKSKAGGASDPLTEGNLDARNAGPAAESAKATQNQQVQDDTVPVTEVAATAPPKKSKKSNKTTSTVTKSSHGDYDDLSSIPLGAEAAPACVSDARPAAAAEAGAETISTVTGVADAVLKGRKSERKKVQKDKEQAKADRKSSSKAEAEVSEIAPAAVSKSKKEKSEKVVKEKSPKSILKKGKK